MKNIVEKINEIEGLEKIGGCSEEQIKEAEKALNMKFPKEYIDYVKEFGCISFPGTEWTGLNISDRLNTVAVTKQEKEYDNLFPEKFFVLENIGVDSALAIVNEEGNVFIYQHNSMKPICNSISEYLDTCLKNE